MNFNIVPSRNTNGVSLTAEVKYDLIVTSDIDKSLYNKMGTKDANGNNVPFTVDKINSEKFHNALWTFIENFNNDNLNEDDINFNKLKKIKTRNALLYLINELSIAKNVEIIKVFQHF